MYRKNHTIFSIIIIALLAIFPRVSFSYPSAEVLGTGSVDPPFDFSVSSTLSGMVLIDDRDLYVSYSETLKIIDLGLFELATTQPAEPDEEEGTDGIITAIAYDDQRDQIIAPQEDGDVLLYDMNKITETPRSVTVVANNKLGPIAVDTNKALAYIADNTAQAIQVLDLSTDKLSTTIATTVGSAQTYTFTDAVYVEATGEVYFTTSIGRVFYISVGGTTATKIDVDATGKKNLVAIDEFPLGNYVYVVDATTPAVVKISTSSHTVVNSGIDISHNPSPTDIVITDVTNPTANYAFVAGAATPGGGMSVINTATDEVLDLGSDTDIDGEPLPISTRPMQLIASSSTDGYVYMFLSNSKLGFLSEHPLVTVVSVTFSDGSTTLKEGQSMTITFKSDQTGTYTIMSGGTVEATGTTLKDSSGNTSGSVTAATDTSVTINHDDNTSAFTEGANDIWIFVTSNSIRGRVATSVTVDTPPPDVTIKSAGFGDGRVYVNFDRLTVSDMGTYRIYVDTDAELVKTKTDVAATVSQASSGSTQTAEVSGLTNGLTYYVAMDAVDNGGNVSHNRTYQFSDGTQVYANPEETVGPAGLLGEKGCQFADESKSYSSILIVFFPILIIIVFKTFRNRLVCHPRALKSWIHHVNKGASKNSIFVIPAKAGIQFFQTGSRLSSGRRLDPDFRRDDVFRSALNRFMVIFIIVLISIFSLTAFAEDSSTVKESDIAPVAIGPKHTKQMWSIEVKGGFWLPQNSTMKSYFGYCCNIISRIEGGLLLQRRYGIQQGVGFMYRSSDAKGVLSGATSQDSFNFIIVPMDTSFVWRVDYFDWRYIVPFTNTGLDYVFFYEGDKGGAKKGIKFGLHGGGGIGINVGEMTDVVDNMDSDWGINEFFVTLEAKYQWINNFGGSGIDLTGPVFSLGFLFEF